MSYNNVGNNIKTLIPKYIISKINQKKSAIHFFYRTIQSQKDIEKYLTFEMEAHKTRFEGWKKFEACL